MATLYIEPGSPWENGYIESFNGKLSDELLDCEVFDTLLEAKVLIEAVAGYAPTPYGRTVRLGYRPRRRPEGDRALDAGPQGVAPETGPYGRGGRSTNITVVASRPGAGRLSPLPFDFISG